MEFTSCAERQQPVCVQPSHDVIFLHCHYCLKWHDRYYGFINRPPYVDFDFEKGEWNAAYFTFGSACSVVEIDCLTGDHQVLSTDIVMDIGKSLNPAIDIGQIEGAFIQVHRHSYQPLMSDGLKVPLYRYIVIPTGH